MNIFHQHKKTPKQILNLTAKNSPFEPQNYPDLGQKQKLKLNEAQKIKGFSFMSKPQNSFENYRSQKNNPFG